MFSSAFVVLALSASALANVFITSPTSSSTFPAGKSASVSWQDDGKLPNLQTFGLAIVALYTGNSQQQTLLQTISASVDVSKTSTLVFTPNPAIGPNGDNYFIRFQSIALKDSTQPQYPQMAFSAKFTLSGMSGAFNATVQAQIDGQSTAPIGGTIAASAPATTQTPVITTSKAAAAATSGSASKTTTAAAAAKTNGANKLAGANIAAFAGVAVVALSAIFH